MIKLYNRLKVPLDTYIDSPIEAIYMLLDKIHIDEISNFVNTFLKQYMFNNNLQNDTVLSTYIQVRIIFSGFIHYEIYVVYNIKFFVINV